MTRTAVTDGDFYLIEQTLDPGGRQLLARTREFMEKSVQPVINQYWTREEFPYDLVVPGLRQLGIAGQAYTGYGCPGGGSNRPQLFLIRGEAEQDLMALCGPDLAHAGPHIAGANDADVHDASFSRRCRTKAKSRPKPRARAR